MGKKKPPVESVEELPAVQPPDPQTEARAVVAAVFGGQLPTDEGLVKAACGHHEGEDLDSLLSFKVYPTKVAIIISTGQKYEYTLDDLVQALKRRLVGGQGDGSPDAE